MKIIQNNKEYGYQQPIINDIDVLGEADISSGTQQVTLTGNLSSYARIIITISMTGYYNATTSIELSYEDFRSGKSAAYSYAVEDQRIRVTYVNDTTVEATHAGYKKHIKIEGVKKAPYVHNDWADITSSCSFSGFSGSSPYGWTIRANDEYVWFVSSGSTWPSSSKITLPSSYKVMTPAVFTTAGNISDYSAVSFYSTDGIVFNSNGGSTNAAHKAGGMIPRVRN